jgi:hypothetical protein
VSILLELPPGRQLMALMGFDFCLTATTTAVTCDQLPLFAVEHRGPIDLPGVVAVPAQSVAAMFFAQFGTFER